jgi:hypothetical protein
MVQPGGACLGDDQSLILGAEKEFFILLETEVRIASSKLDKRRRSPKSIIQSEQPPRTKVPK